jgi:hypothetical protein
MPSQGKKKILGTKSGMWGLPPAAPKATPSSPSSGIEQRAFVRHFCDISAAADAWPARVENISHGGVKIVVGRRFEVGAIIKLEFRVPGEDEFYLLLVKVIRVAEEPAGGWSLGCAFVREITEEEIQKLLATQR